MPTPKELQGLGESLMGRFNLDAPAGERITTFSVYLEEAGLYYAFVFQRADGKQQIQRWTPAQLEACFEGEEPKPDIVSEPIQ